jgi:hypothetical protein
MFAGNCTSQVEFYDSPDDYNYKRAVTWSIVMAYLSHVHPAFQTVFSIEAINEPIQDASKTPGLDRCECHPIRHYNISNVMLMILLQLKRPSFSGSAHLSSFWGSNVMIHLSPVYSPIRLLSLPLKPLSLSLPSSPSGTALGRGIPLTLVTS